MDHGNMETRTGPRVNPPAGKDGTLDPRYFSRVEGVSDGDPWTRATRATPAPAAGESASSTTPLGPRGEARAQAAASSEAAKAGQRQAKVSGVKQPRARSDWMLDRPVAVAGSGRSGSRVGGGAGSKGGGGGEKSAAESESCLQANTGGGERPAHGRGCSTDGAGAPGGAIQAGGLGVATEGAGPASVDVYAILDFEATCEDKGVDGGR